MHSVLWRRVAFALVLVGTVVSGLVRAAGGEAADSAQVCVVLYDEYLVVAAEAEAGADQARELLEKKKALREAQRTLTLLVAASGTEPELSARFEGELAELGAELDAVEHEIALADLDLQMAFARQAHLATLLSLDACDGDPLDPRP